MELETIQEEERKKKKEKRDSTVLVAPERFLNRGGRGAKHTENHYFKKLRNLKIISDFLFSFGGYLVINKYIKNALKN